VETRVSQESLSDQPPQPEVVLDGGRLSGGVMFLAPVLRIGGASILGVLWGRGLLSSGPSWAGLLLLALAMLALEFMACRRGARAEETRARGHEAVVQGPSEAPVRPLMGSVGTSLTRLLDGVGVAFLVTDPGGRVLRAGSAAAALIECCPEEQWTSLNEKKGTFFGLPVEEQEHLASMCRFFGGETASAEGLVTISGSRRQIRWAGRALDGSEGLGTGRMLIMRDVTEERQFEVLKGDFLATISHELRTPLTALRGSLQLVLGRAEALEAVDRQLLEIGIKSAEKLISLINDLLDVDALEHGSIAFQFASLDLRDLLCAAVQALRATSEDHDVGVEIDSDEELPTVYGDRERLLQVLISLLRNAVKHAPPGSTVTVRARGNDSGLQVDVCDRGVGIPPSDQPHVFERFWRAHRSGTDAGAGLGLAICRAVIVRHGGQIWLESEEGKGATFSFFLPRSIFRHERVNGVAEALPAGQDAVLLVEGDDDAQAVLQAALERCGYAVMGVSTGAQGVAAARQEHPAVIVLDLVLPDISGYDVLRILKNSPETASVPVLVLGVAPDRELARALGAWDVLQKPLDFEAVLCSLAGALRQAGRPKGCLVLALGPSVSRDLTVLASVLEREGHKVHRARDISELACWAAANYPDVLVLDDDFLPGTREEAAEQVSYLATRNRIPLVFLTTDCDDGEASARWALIRKPISKDDFVGAVRRALAEARDELGPV
jgi:signal transduction histidine kinase/DNA-binding response OmpR family regulator